MIHSCRDETVNTALVQAIQAQSLERVVLALDAGADPNYIDDHMSCLGQAVRGHFLPVRANGLLDLCIHTENCTQGVRALLYHGADPNMRAARWSLEPLFYLPQHAVEV